MTPARAAPRVIPMLLVALVLGPGYTSGQIPGTEEADGGVARTRRAELRQLADRGDRAGQFALGLLHLHGDVVTPPDLTQALWWMRQAADQGLPDAQLQLGRLYSSGAEIPQNLEEAVRWWRLAAAQGDPGASHELGVAYAEGRGVARDPVEAVSWFLEAANRGEVREAQTRLGIAYLAGEGVAQDDRQAVVWFLMAAGQGDADALYHLGTMYAHGRGVEADAVEAHKWFWLAARLAVGSQDYGHVVRESGAALRLEQRREADRRAREWMDALQRRRR